MAKPSRVTATAAAQRQMRSDKIMLQVPSEVRDDGANGGGSRMSNTIAVDQQLERESATNSGTSRHGDVSGVISTNILNGARRRALKSQSENVPLVRTKRKHDYTATEESPNKRSKALLTAPPTPGAPAERQEGRLPRPKSLMKSNEPHPNVASTDGLRRSRSRKSVFDIETRSPGNSRIMEAASRPRGMEKATGKRSTKEAEVANAVNAKGRGAPVEGGIGTRSKESTPESSSRGPVRRPATRAAKTRKARVYQVPPKGLPPNVVIEKPMAKSRGQSKNHDNAVELGAGSRSILEDTGSLNSQTGDDLDSSSAPRGARRGKGRQRALSWEGTSADPNDEEVQADGQEQQEDGEEQQEDEQERGDTDDTSRIDPDAEYFGAEEEWKKVLDHKNSIGKSKHSKQDKRVPFKTLTQEFRFFVQKVEKLQKLYEEISFEEETDIGKDFLDDPRLTKKLVWIEDQVNTTKLKKLFTESDERAKRMVQDTYTKAIPSMVQLLHKALSKCSVIYRKATDTEMLRHIVRLQEMTLGLCQNVTIDGAAKPITTKLIVGATKQGIEPYLTKIKDVFERILNGRLTKIRDEKEKLAFDERSRKRFEQNQSELQQAQDERGRKAVEGHQKLLDSVARVDALLLARPLRTNTQRPSAVETQPQAQSRNEEWTPEQDEELMAQLQLFQKLPVEQRYLKILNVPSLQNKLPEHIQNRAMYHKSFLEQVYTEEMHAVPRWVSSIRHCWANK